MPGGNEMNDEIIELTELTDRQREALGLFLDEMTYTQWRASGKKKSGRSYSEVARLMGINRHSSRDLITRALGRIDDARHAPPVQALSVERGRDFTPWQLLIPWWLYYGWDPPAECYVLRIVRAVLG